jgi:drug/metabolite transporter (DMT)-like permease
MTATRSLPIAAALGALINATVWGVSWWPLKWLEARGMGSLWATFFIFAVCTIGVLLYRPGSFAALLKTPVLAWLALAAGMTNVCFNIALATGDVVRSVLLFYLMPMWVVMLTRWLLHESITLMAVARVTLALLGAALVLSEGRLVIPIPNSLADWLAVAGGFFFGLNNVILRKYANVSDEARALAMFGGAVVCAPIAIFVMSLAGKPIVFAPENVTWIGLALFAIAVLIANLALQYGASRLRANVLSVLMLAEILVATISSWMAGAATITSATLIGGAFIVSASLLAIFSKSNTSAAH